MVSSHTHGCPEPEVLAAYVDHGLSLAERSRVDAHLASCPHCIAMVAGVVRTVEAVSEFLPVGAEAVEATPRFGRRSVAGLLTAAAAVFVVLAAPSLVRPWLDRDTGLVSLADSVEGERSVLGRLTGGFPHAPLGVPSAGGQGGRAAEADRIVLIAGKIRESFGERDTPSRLHTLGVEQLLAGRYDDAAASLQAAAREQPTNARYVSDVATVQLERARRGLRPDDLPRALASADRARRLDPSLREAWFNRALAATALSLNGQATQAWTEYLARDNASPWATEARKRLEELSKPTPAAAWTVIEGRLQGPIDAAMADEAVRTQVTETRSFIETQLLPDWARAVEAGQNASRELDRVRVMAAAFLRLTGDGLYRDAVAAIDRAEAGGHEQLRRLAIAHQQYAEAAAVFADDRLAAATPGLITAKSMFDQLESPFEYRADLDLGAVAYFTGNAAEAASSLENLATIAASRSYINISARVAWQQGLAAFGQGRLAEAQTHYEETLQLFDQMGDSEQVAAAHNLLAGIFYYLGDENHSWIHFPEALKGLQVSRSPKLRHGLLSAAAISIRRTNPEAALAIQDEVIRNALEWGRQAAVAEAYAARASILSALGQSGAATTDIVTSRQQLALSTDQALRSRVEVAVLTTESDLLRSKNPAAAVAAARNAVAIVEQRRDRLRLAQLQLRLAKANIVWGRLDDAEVALNSGIRVFDEERSSLSSEGRISALEESWQLYETAVELAIKKKDFPRAFAMAERGRVRSLAEARRIPAARSLSEVQASLAPGEAVIALNQFDDELAVWVIRRDRTDITMRPLTRGDAERLVSRQQDEIWHEAATPTAGRALYDEIVRPVLARISGATRVVVVPDVTYENAAFAAFWDSSRRRFLVEDVTLTLAPSVDAYAARTAPAARPSDEPLILGGPDRSGDANARAIAAVYPASHLVTGPSATAARFFADAPSRSVVHLSARTSSNRAYPLLSRLVLADEPGHRHSGAILGRDIAARPMSHTNLVVIDEVETTETDRGEGTLSLARAFMAAGVPAVLGTLPGAGEAATRDLMVSFHRQMLSNISAAEALTKLQRNVLQSNGRRLGAWSALVMYGSDR